MFLRVLLISGLILFLYSCTKKETIYTPSVKLDPYKIYQEGLDAFEQNDYFFASKKFSEAELNFEITDYAAKSSIMASFALYGINFYDQAEENIKRYLRTYPGDQT